MLAVGEVRNEGSSFIGERTLDFTVNFDSLLHSLLSTRMQSFQSWRNFKFISTKICPNVHGVMFHWEVTAKDLGDFGPLITAPLPLWRCADLERRHVVHSTASWRLHAHGPREPMCVESWFIQATWATCGTCDRRISIKEVAATSKPRSAHGVGKLGRDDAVSILTEKWYRSINMEVHKERCPLPIVFSQVLASQKGWFNLIRPILFWWHQHVDGMIFTCSCESFETSLSSI